MTDDKKAYYLLSHDIKQLDYVDDRLEYTVDSLGHDNGIYWLYSLDGRLEEVGFRKYLRTRSRLDGERIKYSVKGRIIFHKFYRSGRPVCNFMEDRTKTVMYHLRDGFILDGDGNYWEI